MQAINVRGTFVVSQACLPHLKQGHEPAHPHALPADLARSKWLGGHVGYTLAKYGMSLIGSVWPRSCARPAWRPTRCGR